MSPKIKARLTGAGCRKRFCTANCGHPARHHIRHQAMWLRIWTDRRRGEARWLQFVANYHAFRPQDIVVLGANHHAEVHILYDIIIEKHKKLTGVSFSHYTWEMAEDLMDHFEHAFRAWIDVQTPGFSYQMFGRLDDYRRNRSKYWQIEAVALSKKVLTAAKKYEIHRAFLEERFATVCTVQVADHWRIG